MVRHRARDRGIADAHAERAGGRAALTTMVATATLAACGGAAGLRSTVRPATRPVAAATSPRHDTPIAARTDCFVQPAACGYPAPSTSGVPAGLTLTKYAGDMVVDTPGTVVADVAVTGSIEITAGDVTVRDTSVTSSGATGHDIWIAPGVRDVLIEDSTLRGASATTGAVQYAVQNSGSSSNTGRRLAMYFCTTCWAGAGSLKDSYVMANAVASGAHYEPVYYGGGGGALSVDHDTLLNPHGQTADVFASVDFGNQTALTITNNLMAGGGYMIYGGASGGHGEVVGPVVVSGNRFARCVTPATHDRSSGGYRCRDSVDSYGYWPKGGYYGVAAWFRAGATTWSNNHWDASGAPVPFPG